MIYHEILFLVNVFPLQGPVRDVYVDLSEDLMGRIWRWCLIIKLLADWIWDLKLWIGEHWFCIVRFTYSVEFLWKSIQLITKKLIFQSISKIQRNLSLNIYMIFLIENMQSSIFLKSISVNTYAGLTCYGPFSTFLRMLQKFDWGVLNYRNLIVKLICTVMVWVIAAQE